ncbi:probable sulfite mitochondrial-like [Stylonychia lemnae]|uniref:Probable sulfite mitochondrial-like n=1 Tax=Stylonychia lemnae TaxID=5949 RepID=A0A078ART1_STYLE|nr:probable sulfite mitochondrial-like [Stylonychia lemnae]|eukprot:CDW84696.1 probable sulfite mitochondrial-like [Stylonychia lemnae]
MKDRIWVSYKDSVYDITDFIKAHPGGTEKILLSSGGQLEGFFKFYPFHQKDHVQKLLSQYKIGILHEDDRVKQSANGNDIDEEEEMLKQLRSKELITLQEVPLIAETNPIYLRQHFITPVSEMFIRNHQKIPQRIDPEYFKLKVFENKNKKAKYTLDDLKSNFQPKTVMSTIACSGNRRGGLKNIYPTIQGNNWTYGAIANCYFTGVSIIDLLKDLGYDLEQIKDKHLVVEGLDIDVQGKHFQVSVPISHVIDPLNEVILAYAQNGEELIQDHGYPLRLIVPGFVGVRNCKWVYKLSISDEEATSAQQKENYKFIQERDSSKIDYSKYKPIFAYIINSAITYPLDKESMIVEKDSPCIYLKGWATGNPHLGTPVKEVQISFDNGQTWEQAQITHKEVKDHKHSKIFSWVLWEYKIDVNRFQSNQPIKASVRSVDLNGDTQLKSIEELYNLKGLLNNSPHSVEFQFVIKE